MSRQKGFAAIELALLTPFFFMVLFGVVEIARMAYVWNTLDAITQRAVRAAVVCPPNHNMIRHVALFGKSNDTNSAVSVRGFTPENVNLEYLDENFNPTGGTFPIAFVRASITNFEHELLIPLLGQTVQSPSFAATLPSESMGYDPTTGGRRCFGTAI